MPIKQQIARCTRCNELTPHNIDVPNHIAHGLLTLFTAGLYLPIWVIVAIGGQSPGRCVKCGGVERVVVTQASAEATRASHKTLALIFVAAGVLVGVFAILVAAGVM